MVLDLKFAKNFFKKFKDINIIKIEAFARGKIMKKEQEIQMLKEFSDANSTSGFEEEFVKLFSTYAKNTADITVDGMLNVYAAKKENKGNRPVIQMDAHSDAVGFITQAVRPNGLIKFVPLGGWVKYNIPALRVKIRNRDGEYIPGVVGYKASALYDCC